MEPQPIVYVVDDEPAIVRTVTEIIHTLDFRVQSYNSADEFLRAYRPAGPACLVLDVKLPGMSGLELQEHLAHAGSTLPIIVIAGYATAHMAVEAMKKGAIDFLEKPFRMKDLSDAIRKAIELDTRSGRFSEP